MPASGTYGYGVELAAYGDLNELGAVVVKSLSAMPWAGNPAPRLVPLRDGSLLNAVGLPNPGVTVWAESALPDLLKVGADVVASLWGHTRAEFLSAAQLLAPVTGPIAWEINLSCPNLDRSNELFAHHADSTRSLVAELRSIAGPEQVLWAKLSPDVPDIVEIAAAAQAGGADAVTIANTFAGMSIDLKRMKPAVGNGQGGVSGPAVRPFVVAMVFAVHDAIPDLPIVAAGGVMTGEDAAEFLVAGASAVQVGTANFVDPRATHRILRELREWCRRNDRRPADLIGSAVANKENNIIPPGG